MAEWRFSSPYSYLRDPDDGKWSVSIPGCLIPEKMPLLLIEQDVGLETWGTEDIPTQLGFEPLFPGCQARSLVAITTTKFHP